MTQQDMDFDTREDKSHLTARSRNRPSVPMQYLDKMGLLKGRLLDFGCGKGFDAQHYGMEKYDPTYHSIVPRGKFDTIACNYVLNTLDKAYKKGHVLNSIRYKLKKSGTAYITVRRDVKVEGYTSKGTYQENTRLDDLEIVKETSTYCIYRMVK